MEYYVKLTNYGEVVAESHSPDQQEALRGLDGLALPNDRITVYEALRASEGDYELINTIDTWRV